MKDFLMQLLQFESVSRDRETVREALDFLADKARKEGLDVRMHEDPMFCIAGRGDLRHPDVGLLCHVDVVPPYFPPRIDENKIYGRGSIDMKGPAVASLFAVLESDHPNVAIAFTGDEETTGNAAAFLSTMFVPEQVLIVPDQNRDFNITKESKGLILFEASLTGDSAHGSMPWAGSNAVSECMEFYDELCQRLRVDNGIGWSNTLNLAYVNTANEANNVVPSSAEIGLDFRFQSRSAEHWLDIIDAVVDDFEAVVDVQMSGELISIDVTQELESYMDIVERVTGEQPGLLRNTSSCDARFYMGKVPTLIVTKCSGGLSHSDEEYVLWDSLVDMKTVFRQYLEKLREQRTV